MAMHLEAEFTDEILRGPRSATSHRMLRTAHRAGAEIPPRHSGRRGQMVLPASWPLALA